jgi:hypothetical protein
VNQSGSAYGSGDLTPDAIRTARFTLHDGRYDPSDVHEFLEQVASAMEVLSSTSAAQAMRRELQRNAEISSRVVLAGQDTAERLRQQAAEDARTIIEDTKRLAEQLRDASREELGHTREHIESLRVAFIDEMRDMYDRVGATLYRFERAGGNAEDAPSGGAQTDEAPAKKEQLPPAWTQLESAPAPSVVDDAARQIHPIHTEDLAANEPVSGPEILAEAASQEIETELVQLDEPPALDGGSWLDGPTEPEQPTAAAPAEPEPLVDLRAIQAQIDAAAAEMSAAPAPSAEALEAEVPPVVESAAGEPVTDDDRVEQLLAGTDDLLGAGMATESPSLPEPPALAHDAAPASQALPDVDALRAFVLQSIADGQPQEAIAQYLHDTYGMDDPAGFIGATLSSAS